MIGFFDLRDPPFFSVTLVFLRLTFYITQKAICFLTRSPGRNFFGRVFFWLYSFFQWICWCDLFSKLPFLRGLRFLFLGVPLPGPFSPPPHLHSLVLEACTLGQDLFLTNGCFFFRTTFPPPIQLACSTILSPQRPHPLYKLPSTNPFGLLPRWAAATAFGS